VRFDDFTITRRFARASRATFSIPPIAALLKRWLVGYDVIVDPFARETRIGTVRNDIDPMMPTEYHLEADVFCAQIYEEGCRASAVLFDPPYSPRQIAECYKRVGVKVSTEETQNARLYKRVRDGLDKLLLPGGLAISCGWWSTGFGRRRGYTPEEILLVAHGGAHNDTIVVVERKGYDLGCWSGKR
jgi:hypothetical protein